MGIVIMRKPHVVIAVLVLFSIVLMVNYSTPEAVTDSVNTASLPDSIIAPSSRPLRSRMRIAVVPDAEADDSEEDGFFALPVSSPLYSANLGLSPQTSHDGLFLAPRGKIFTEVLNALLEARENPDTRNYQKVVGRESNESMFPWTAQSEVFSTGSSCLAVVSLSRPRVELYDKYRSMVNEHEYWQDQIAMQIGPDAFRLVAKSEEGAEVGTTIFTSDTADDQIISYIGIINIGCVGTYRIELEHLHRAFGAFTDVDRKGAYCPLPPSPGKSRKAHREAAKPIDFDNRVKVKEGRLVVSHVVQCAGIKPLPRKDLPLCHAELSAQELLDGGYVAIKDDDELLQSNKVVARNFTIRGERFRWSPRSCRTQAYSAPSQAGALLQLLQNKSQRILFLGDSQMRTMVNAYFSVVFNEPPAENNRGEYRKVASIASTTGSRDSWLEFLWDPQGELVARFDLVMNRNVRAFERLLSGFLKKHPKKGLISSVDLPSNGKRRRLPHTVTQLPLTQFSPEGVSMLRSWKFWKEGKPTMIVIGFGGWNMWLCESFEEADDRIRKMVKVVQRMISFQTKVVFVGWPAPIDSLSIVAAKRRMTSSRIGLLMEITRMELAAAGAIVLPFFEMAMPFPELSSKASTSHYDNTTVLYGMVDFISTFLT